MNNIQSLLGIGCSELMSTHFLVSMQIPERVTIEDTSYVNFTALGISLTLPGYEIVGAVHLHADDHEGFSCYLDQIPGGISFDRKRQEARIAWLPESIGR